MMSSRITIITGRFGSGKTEIALNYAVRLGERQVRPLLIDLDIVTPYFRTREKAEEVARHGVQVVSPFPVGQYIHVPAISPQILGAIEQRARPVVIDLGGDEQGSRALRQYAPTIERRSHAMLFVVNPYRPFMDSLDGIRSAIAQIEASARVRVSHLVSNPNLMSQSSPASFHEGHRLVQEAGRAFGLPIAFAVVSERLSEAMDGRALDTDLMVIHRFFLMFDSSEQGM
jgi:hypothetical protein